MKGLADAKQSREAIARSNRAKHFAEFHYFIQRSSICKPREYARIFGYRYLWICTEIYIYLVYIFLDF